jgi:nucleoside-diphosphate-sugar epimerase
MGSQQLLALPEADLDHMFYGLGEADWRFFSKKRLFITGGSGFLGKWLLSAILTANQRLSLDCQIEVLSRSPRQFCETVPHIASADAVVIHEGDVRDFTFPRGGFDIVVHAATDVIAQNMPLETFSTCIDGTRRVLEFAQRSGTKDFLLTSSGAVYGRHPSAPTGLSEDYTGGPDPLQPSSAYGEGKRASEWLACAVAAETQLRVKIARIYAQVGPYLPMDRHFAIGNFISDALAKREIIIRGDGTPFRSYLYAADTAVWLWAMVLRGSSGRAWNVGGADGISIAALAQRVATLLDSSKGIKILTQTDPAKAPECYVPDVGRARIELKLPSAIGLDDAILRTAEWARSNRQFNE